jgi:hypothetical protein
MHRYLVLCLMAATLSTKGMSNHSPFSHTPLKTLNISVNADGLVVFDRDTLMIDDLAKELQTRLWKSYLGTGRMQDSIKVTFTGEVLMGIRGATLEAIKSGQTKALNEICVQKYKRTYENLSTAQKKKVKKQFPVLFQELR